jgi:hypothetical protein
MNIQVKFIILTEHISFIPCNILNACAVLNIKKPNKELFKEMMQLNNKKNNKKKEKQNELLNEIDTNTVINIKEIHSFTLIDNVEELPKDIFNIICDQIIKDITLSEKINFITFRDSLYDILIYNLDVVECIWYILTHFILLNKLDTQDISDIINKTYIFLKYYNNNYRPIYHLESIMFYLITKINKYGSHERKSNERKSHERKSITNIRNTSYNSG